MKQDQYDYVYGINAVEAVLQHAAFRVQTIYTGQQRDDRRMQKILQQAAASGVQVEQLDRTALEALASSAGIEGKVHQHLIAQCRPARARDERFLQELVAGASQPLLLLVLDGVTDPHNLGACMRSANAAGAQAVVVPGDNAVHLTPVVRKVASGAAELTPLAVVRNLARCIGWLQEAGVWVMGADAGAGQSLYQLDLGEHTALVLGAEGRGLRRLTRERCDALFSIPMAGQVESLNVSVAAGICLFEALRQRGVAAAR